MAAWVGVPCLEWGALPVYGSRMLVPQTEVIITKDGAELGRYTVTPGEYVIGREGDIPVEAELVSRRHALLTVNYSDWLIEDLGSTNGTQLNGQPVSGAMRVWPSQKIQVGAATIELHRVQTQPADGQSLSPQAASVRRYLPPEFLRGNKYAIERPIAQGGMGAILAAQEAGLRRPVAMKVMLESGGESDLVRFIEEAQITGQLQHPNIVPVYELGVDEHDQVFYTMKLVEGITLKKVLELLRAEIPATVGKYPLNTLLTIFLKVCDALAYAHAKRVIHRDLKPENLMLGSFGEVLVMDWGLAKVLHSAGTPAHGSTPGGQDAASVRAAPRVRGVLLSSHDAGAASTLAGTIMGTPHFMSPEQAAGKIQLLDARSDIFSLGAILYQILTLDLPFQGRTVDEVLEKVRRCAIMPPERAAVARAARDHLKIKPKVPSALASVAMKALSLRPEERYQSVTELQREIEAWQGGFATGAEKAGAWKQFTLFIRRNKTVSAAAAIIVVLTTGFLIKVIASERRARANEKQATESLHRLRGTAPTFAAQAAALVEKRDIAGALEKIEFATSLAPDEAEYWVSKGHILESLSRLADARDAYRQALAHNPTHAFAKENAEFCDAALKQENNPGQLSGDTRHKLQNLMRREGRVAEAIALLGALGKDRKAIYDTWRAALDHAGIKQQLTQGDDGLLSLDLWKSGIDNLEALRGMPLFNLNIAETKVSDLGPLSGMPLRSLNINGCAQVRDFTPLKGMNLTYLMSDGVPISDIAALAGMPLETLVLNGTKVTDLGLLSGMPLRLLGLRGSPVSDLTPLRGLQITSLDIEGTPVKDLSPLKGMPLKKIVLHNTRVTDLAALTGMPLLELNITGTQIRDLAPLRGMKLESFDATGTSVSDLAPLDGMPLTNLGLLSTAVRDLSPLKHSKIKILDIRDTPVTDISPLRGQPIERLNCWADRIPDLTPLQTMPLKKLWAFGAKLNDLAFLKNVPLDELGLDGSTIADIRGLAGMPLRALILTRTGVRDLTPLATCRKLEQLAFPPECKDIEFLRSLPSLQRLDTTWGTGTGVSKPAAVFWKEYDAKKAAAPK